MENKTGKEISPVGLGMCCYLSLLLLFQLRFYTSFMFMPDMRFPIVVASVGGMFTKNDQRIWKGFSFISSKLLIVCLALNSFKNSRRPEREGQKNKLGTFDINLRVEASNGITTTINGFE
jgi:hypothetical protein